jgi:hypothetical protein
MVHWIRTYTGRKTNPVHLKVSDIDIVDIAHALSNLCRFTGHVKFHYSVALHSLTVSRLCSPKNKLWGLLHDATEAYINDIPSPLKCQKEMSQYRFIEHNAKNVIAEAFNLPSQIPMEVDIIDKTIVHDEGRLLFKEWDLPRGHESVISDIPQLDPEYVKLLFLETFNNLII